MSRAAIVMTVRNEQDLLRSNVLYHRHLGIERFYVFLDGTTDRTPDTVADLDAVMILPSSSAESFLEVGTRRDRHDHSPGLREVVLKSASHHEARQMLNTIVALERARDEGIEWLISLDPDELICLDPQVTMEGQLVDFLTSLPSSVEAVSFPTSEIVQRRATYENVLAEATLFKHERSWVPRPLYDPYRKQVRRHFYQPRKVLGLAVPKRKTLSWWYGHRLGKSAARTSLDLLPRVHTFGRFDGGRLETRSAGRLLHYLLYSADDFVKKFKNYVSHPDTLVSGHALSYRKRVWIDMVNDPSMSEADLRDYYDRWVAFDDAELAGMKAGNAGPRIVEVDAVVKAFRRLDVREPAVQSDGSRSSAGVSEGPPRSRG
jgi:hypothetical protein